MCKEDVRIGREKSIITTGTAGGNPQEQILGANPNRTNLIVCLTEFDAASTAAQTMIIRAGRRNAGNSTRVLAVLSTTNPMANLTVEDWGRLLLEPIWAEVAGALDSVLSYTELGYLAPLEEI